MTIEATAFTGFGTVYIFALVGDMTEMNSAGFVNCLFVEDP